jgi:hypothetical protein
VTLTANALRSMSPERLDALKEVANIGAGHAGDGALADDGRPNHDRRADCEYRDPVRAGAEIAGADVPIVSVMMDMHGFVERTDAAGVAGGKPPAGLRT